MSLNNATVKLAEQVGYDKVAQLAHAAGIKSVQATPAMALGAYDATPVDMAGAYTPFSNGGPRPPPLTIGHFPVPPGAIDCNISFPSTTQLQSPLAYLISHIIHAVLVFC